MKKVLIYDCTLREGAQSEGISYSVSDKLQIAKALDAFGVAYLEAGNPFSNPKDIEFFEKAAKLDLKNVKLCAFGSTRRKNLSADKDENIASLLRANTPCIAIFGKCSKLHIEQILGVSEKENLDMVYDTVSYLVSKGKEVIFDAEHYYDAYRENSECVLKVLSAAKEAGASFLCLCDTNGGTLPEEIERITRETIAAVPGNYAVHCHNDCGCAVASSLSAVNAGAVMLQGTFIGIGERCGNADLSVLIPNLMLKKGYDCGVKDLTKLTDLAGMLYELSNHPTPNDKPYVGRSAFAHKGGMHIDAMMKNPVSYEHIAPEEVGNKRRFLMSEVSGRTMLLAKIASFAPELKKDDEKTLRIMAKVKELEHIGYQFETADASFELMARNILGTFKPHFKLKMYKTSGEKPSQGESAYAMLRIEVDGKEETAAAFGTGPVHALDLALRKALTVFYPELKKVRLTDYKVRVLASNQAAASTVRVLIESTDGINVWTTVGVSTDIIEASFIALVDSIEYILLKNQLINK